jgi:hypothetical protein
MARGSRSRKIWERISKRRHDAREKRRRTGEKIVPNRRLQQDRPQKPGASRMSLREVDHNLFILLYEISKLSSNDYHFLRERGFKYGYYNVKTRKFVVVKDGEYYHGIGNTSDGWERL